MYSYIPIQRSIFRGHNLGHSNPSWHPVLSTFHEGHRVNNCSRVLLRKPSPDGSSQILQNIDSFHCQTVRLGHDHKIWIDVWCEKVQKLEWKIECGDQGKTNEMKIYWEGISSSSMVTITRLWIEGRYIVTTHLVSTPEWFWRLRVRYDLLCRLTPKAVKSSEK